MNSKYVDAHCHMEDKAFNKNRDEIIERSKKQNVEIITSGASLGGCLRALDLKDKYNIYITLGYHPSKVRADDKVVNKVYNIIKANKNKILGVGEIGMDIKDENYERQEKIFKKFLSLAEEINKPIVVHARGFEKKIFEITKNRVDVMFHCYGGDVDLAKEIGKEGHLISISTLVCFSEHHKELVKRLDLEFLTTETDSPYLSPIRGVKNEPANVKLVVKEIAKIKEEEEEEVKKTIYKNTCKFFGTRI
ncbi:hydrolase, TatD family [Methanocaldococcus vulcanius M7]|uniref:Hydrolase, TatD family n=1 Tax=Methanocaldococcus vulcanius (strain ATCC 700851 / DSM 12094 / M7) TaxID=579137 RepID=C9RI97_METVM|nr:YchF/TatD family DNA exonuclease [Methanocaldococcus vulcanius]ACX73299.1 hydrolase, TatD family [Methanocaldococcus vulcanius M7]